MSECRALANVIAMESQQLPSAAEKGELKTVDLRDTLRAHSLPP